MDNKLRMILITVGVVMTIQLYQTFSNSANITKLMEIVARLDKLVSDESDLPPKFGVVYTTFGLYNPEIDSTTVKSFLSVVTHFELAPNDTVFNWLVGQICLESGAKQYYLKGDRNSGKVVRGLSGEVGIAQIMPSTAIDYLSNHVDDPSELYALGVTDFSFVKESKNVRSKMVEWLSYTNNNLVLWGLMTRDNMDTHGTLRGFVAYNTGSGGMKRFVSCNLASRHSYIVNLRGTLEYIAEKTTDFNGISDPSGMRVAHAALR